MTWHLQVFVKISKEPCIEDGDAHLRWPYMRYCSPWFRRLFWWHCVAKSSSSSLSCASELGLPGVFPSWWLSTHFVGIDHQNLQKSALTVDRLSLFSGCFVGEWSFRMTNQTWLMAALLSASHLDLYLCLKPQCFTTVVRRRNKGVRPPSKLLMELPVSLRLSTGPYSW